MTLLSKLRARVATRIPKSPRAQRVLAAGAFLVGSLLLSASIFATGPNASPEARTEKAWPVSIVTVEPSRLSPTFTAFGRIESAQVARIQTDVMAPVAHVAVREGDWVASGEILIELDTAALELQVAEREAELDAQRAHLRSVEGDFALARETTSHYQHVFDVSQKKLVRHQDLFAKRMIAQSILDEALQQASTASIEYQKHLRQLADFPNQVGEAKAGIKRSTALLERARIDVARGTVRAPFSGPILSVLVSPGNHTSLGAPLIEIADAASFEIRAEIPDAYRDAMRRHLADGNAISARWGEASVQLIRFASNVRAGQSGLDAFFAIDPAAVVTAQPGRVVTLSVQLPPEADVVALPPQSIYDNDRIYAVSDDRLQSIVIERIGDHTTAQGEHRVLVRSHDLHAGQRIITTQLPKAITGLRVAPVG